MTGLQPAPPSVTAILGRRSAGPTEAVGAKIPYGRQHDTLVSLAGSMRRRGLGVEEIDAALQEVNRRRCEVPGPPENVRRIAESVTQYEPDEPLPTVESDPEPAALPGCTAAELLAEVPEEPDWLIPGVIARTWTIKVAAREKVGKGTFILNLLGCLERGKGTVFGPATTPVVTALIYTEEPKDSIREKVAASGLQRARIIFGYQLGNLPDWPTKAKRLVGIAVSEGHGVVFVDNISRAAAVQDEAGVEFSRAVEALSERLKAADLAGIVDHHHRKAGGPIEDMSRGGTAVAGAADNNIEMQRVGDWDSRVRKLSSRGRISATAWQCQIALSEDGTTYERVVGADEPQTVRERVRLEILEGAPDGLTAAEFAAMADVSPRTARRTLEEFVLAGRATAGGTLPKRYHAMPEPDPAKEPPI